MRHGIASLLLLGLVSSPAIAFQADSSTAGTSRIPACSVFTRDMALKASSAEGKRVVDLMAPREEDLGSGSSCKIGRIRVVTNPFARPDQMRRAPEKGWQPVTGVGDAAFYEADSSFANLYVWTGARHFAIQMSLGPDDTGESLKPNIIALAKDVIAKLR